MGLEYLLECIKDYKVEYKAMIIDAYEFAYRIHKGQKRKSGEDYIIHPLSVACILAQMRADAETICAGLLHDTIEDGVGITKEQLEITFGPTVAFLVDGVTKLKKLDFGNDQRSCDAANTRKIIETILSDIRIFIIKLADRLHNMRTEDYQPRNKQIEHSEETMELFVPFANLIGAYGIMVELEDYCFKYLKPSEYKYIEELRQEVLKEYQTSLDELIIDLTRCCNGENINFNLLTTVKHPYELFKKYRMYGDLSKIHDLYSVKINLNDRDQCYRLRDIILGKYPSLEEKSKDYIASPKNNMYSSLHTSIIGPEGRKFQVQIQTKEMHTINTHGITAYWALLGSREGINVSKLMQDEVSAYPFFKVLRDIRGANFRDEDFNQEVKETILTKHINAKTPNGDIIELPLGATVVDFAYRIHSDIGDTMTGAMVNGEYVPLNYEVQNNDVITIITNKDFIGPKIDMIPLCKTSTAKRKVKELQRIKYRKEN